jgi:hypothetical protein
VINGNETGSPTIKIWLTDINYAVAIFVRNKRILHIHPPSASQWGAAKRVQTGKNKVFTP